MSLGDIQNLFGTVLVQMQELSQKNLKKTTVTAELKENQEYSV